MSASTLKKTYFAPAERASKEEIKEAWHKVLEAGLVSSVLDAMPQPAMILNGQRQIIAVNRHMVKELGFSSHEEALGNRPGELFGCYETKEAPNGCGTGKNCRYCGLLKTVLTATKADTEVDGECSVRLASGKAMEYHVLAALRKIDDLSVVFVGLRDLSAEKRRKILERTFFHDILNTAGGIKGFMTLIESENPTDANKEFRQAIAALSNVLVDEIQSYRQLTQAEDDTLVLHKTTISLRRFVENLRILYKSHQVAKGKTIRIADFDDRRLHTDLSLLRRVLANMLKNGLEATPEGESVVLDVRNGPEYVEFSVTNPGVMSREIQAQIFHRSFSTKGQDRGLGTYSMKLLGERYLGGSVSFESNPEIGTVFRFRLHGETAHQSEEETLVPVVEEKPDVQEKLSKIRVLLADDDRFSRTVNAIMLKNIVGSVHEAENGRDVLKCLQSGIFDIVLLDVHMPIMDGLETARAIRKMDGMQDLPVLAITAGTLEEDRVACFKAGMNDFIDKPVDPDDLRRSLIQWAIDETR